MPVLWSAQETLYPGAGQTRCCEGLEMRKLLLLVVGKCTEAISVLNSAAKLLGGKNRKKIIV